LDGEEKSSIIWLVGREEISKSKNGKRDGGEKRTKVEDLVLPSTVIRGRCPSDYENEKKKGKG